MRASTVFILALALLIGLAVAAGAKSAGLFDKKAPLPAADKPAPPKVLVAKVNLFEDLTVTADQVYLRDLQPAEEAKLKDRFGDNWRDKTMQPLVTAAHLRVARQNILADTILLRDQFADAGLPERLTTGLEANTRAVNVSVPKNRAAGGVVRVGEYVDVLLTTKIGVGDREELRTACIARGCKVIMKRNVMWQMVASDPDDKPLSFTVQANVYRASLIEYAQSHGQLSLLPSGAPTRFSGTYSDPSSKEYATEDQRIDDVVRGVRTIGTEDLVRIFQVVAPAPLPVPPPPIRIPHLSGVQNAGTTVLPGVPEPAPVKPAGGPTAEPAGTKTGAADPRPVGFTFRQPKSER